MKIEAGTEYMRRDGGRVRAEATDVGEPFPFRAGFNHYLTDGTHLYGSRELDLIAEWPTSPVREVTRKEIVPGIYGHILVDRTANDGALVVLGFKTTGGIFPDARSLFSSVELRTAATAFLELADALDAQP